MLSNALATSRLRLPDEKIDGSTWLPGPGPEVCRKLELARWSQIPHRMREKKRFLGHFWGKSFYIENAMKIALLALKAKKNAK